MVWDPMALGDRSRLAISVLVKRMADLFLVCVIVRVAPQCLSRKWM